MKVLYFSATGNCLYVAKRLGGELLSIPQLQKKGIYEITGDVVGIVCPVYGFTLPNLVKEYLEKATIKAEYVFSIMTFGNLSIAALTQMKKAFEKQGVQLHYSNQIRMVDNYLPIFEVSSQLKKNKDESIEVKINNIVSDIKERKQSCVKHGGFQKSISNIISALWGNKKMVNKRDNNFTVSELCNGCGTCRNVCPVGNIAGSGKPEYQHRCEFCLACIHLCPKNAIHLKNERSDKRFINPHVKLSELIQANKQD
ncbi:MAG: EFR1 family ferrodoxin [Spirochaetaceae bacterium]|jgi:ferredoxin|nr:EFR1 family ferrodoxin [Spirochaetaceae bacterium]